MEVNIYEIYNQRTRMRLFVKNGRFQSFLAAGSCHYIKAMGYELKIVPMTGAVNTCGIPVEVLMKTKNFPSV